MDEVTTVAGLRGRIARGETTAREVTEAHLARIGQWNGTLRAFVEVTADEARRAARELDALPAERRGRLHGVPVGIKDIIDVAGHPTRAGSLTRADAQDALRDAPVVARLRAAGAVVVGKTHTVEFAFGGWGTNTTVGTPHNPWDLARHRTPGGSSNGSGVAVGAGLVPAALGTDTGGSVRLPAHFCGCVGLKTTIGLVDRSGVVELAPTLDTIGPLTASVADAAEFLVVMAGEATGTMVDGDALAADVAGFLGRGISGRRIGVLAVDVEMEAAVGRAVEAACEALARGGARLTDVRLPVGPAAISDICGELIAAEGYVRLVAEVEEEPNRLGPPVRGRLIGGRDLPAPRLVRALEGRQALKTAIAALMADLDVLVLACSPTTAPVVGEHDEAVSPGRLTRFVNHCDLCAISVPFGTDASGLPIGIQVVAKGRHEPVALAIAAFLERAAGGPRLAPLA